MPNKMNYEQLSPRDLVEHAIKNGEGRLTDTGALSVRTGKYTGRSPKDKFIVENDETKNNIYWGKVNKPISEENYKRLFEKVETYMNEISTYRFKGYVGTDEAYRQPVEVITEFAWHNLFAQQLLVRPNGKQDTYDKPLFTVIDVPGLKANPEEDGTNSEAFIITNIRERVILIGGTEYAGEIKKSLFGIMNYLLPFQEVLPMHCGANSGKEGDVSLFFGLSGTGKTTLSSSVDRYLIGDDEHAWTDETVFNLEGGCYAKTIGLEKEKEPDIYQAIRFGTVLENVVADENGKADYHDGSITENGRAAYPISYIFNIVPTGVGKTPNTIFFLTADAFGVLPPISKLTHEQALYYFLNGYTSKLAGTERGITEPVSTFSACFGEPFLPLEPMRYGKLFAEKIKKHEVDVYLVNTGWGAGGYGKSERIPLKYTRSMVSAALSGVLKNAEYQKESIFGLYYPTVCSGVPSERLNPKYGWENEKEYEKRANELKLLFEENYKKFKKE